MDVISKGLQLAPLSLDSVRLVYSRYPNATWRIPLSTPPTKKTVLGRTGRMEEKWTGVAMTLFGQTSLVATAMSRLYTMDGVDAFRSFTE